MWWCHNIHFGFTLSDVQVQSCKLGNYNFENSHTFDPSKKITKVEVIIRKDEFMIIRINFYHHQQRLVAVGWIDENVRKEGGRVEIVEIADDEQLIGCQLHQYKDDYFGSVYFKGVTWLKIKLTI